jgi:DNA-binding MarR family transcriptional regulator
VTDDAAGDMADVLAVLINRRYRATLYGMLTEGLGHAVNETTYPVISGLARTGPRTASELADEIRIDRSVVSRHAARLETAGLLRRTEHPRDGRATILVLTARGDRIVDLMRGRLYGHFGRILADSPDGLGEKTLAGLRRLLEAP